MFRMASIVFPHISGVKEFISEWYEDTDPVYDELQSNEITFERLKELALKDGEYTLERIEKEIKEQI